MARSVSLERLNPRNAGDVRAVAALHTEYLPHSSIVGLGERFLRDFYYVRLVEDGLIGCTVCRADGQIVGFISYTLYPSDFMQRGIRRHLASLFWIMLRGVLTRPSRLRGIWTALSLLWSRRREGLKAPQPGVGEGLSIATAAAYRDCMPNGGTARMAARLFESARDYFRHAGYHAFYVLVEPSNIASNKFCAAMGCRMENVTVMGRPTHRFVCDLQPAHHRDAGTPAREAGSY